jgi:glycyl-tRNA synthetase
MKMAKEKGKKEGKEQGISIDELAAFCKRKGFVFPSGEIYGSLAGFWDFGPVGVELKNNLKRDWWNFFIRARDDMAGIDGSILTHPRVWAASGHVENFSDMSVICKKCKKVSKIDRFEIDKAVCNLCGGELDKKSAKDLNLMFKTQVGPIKENSVESYLRPETAQLIFANFKNIAECSRLKLPFGIGQIGKAFRNEIAPRDFLFRSREFEQMEIEYFIFPDEKCPYKIPDISISVYSAEMQAKGKEAREMKIKEALEKGVVRRDWHAYWLSQCLLWFKSLGCDLGNFRIRQHKKDELAHYSSDCWDIEYKFPFGWKELTGIADRSDYDLKRHEQFSGKDLKIFVEGKGKILPHVVCEPSFGVERAFLVVMLEAYEHDKKRENIVLHLAPNIAPIKAAVFPIVKDEKMIKLSEEIYKELRKEWSASYDERGSIGRRYARADESGTPMCITVDEQSLKDKNITIRWRDTTEQVRVKISELRNILRKVINEGQNVFKLGRRINTRVK